ncbi:sensor histidine kinase [Microcoleus vaginatus PCC 9802]|nr:sensor histidine kinase [Microcoleus vaginatus PCC 9802]
MVVRARQTKTSFDKSDAQCFTSYRELPSFKSRGESRKSEPARQWQLNSRGIWSRIFDPFFTTKPADEGRGLGLEIVKKSVEKHSGKIKVTSVIEPRTCIVSIPIAV